MTKRKDASKLSQTDIEKLIAENKALKQENHNLNCELYSAKLMLNSKRFRFADGVANLYNGILPVGTVRRRIVAKAAVPARAISKRRATSEIRKIERLLSPHKNIIIMQSIPWNTPLRQRPHHLAKCLADQGFFVIYLEQDEALVKFRQLEKNFITVNSLDIIMQLHLKKNKHYYFFFNNVANNPLSTIQAIKDKGYQLVYEYIDEFAEDISGSIVNQLSVWRSLKQLKPAVVLASADKLYREAAELVGKDKVLLSKNAVNVADFDFHTHHYATPPAGLKSSITKHRPIIGYYGAISPWLDYDLIHYAAQQRPQYDFAYIGVDYQNSLKKLNTKISNISYLGPKEYLELPKYSAHFDCAIIPFNTGEIAKGTSPVKLFEFMAMGLPTVGTKDLRECKGYKHVYLSKDYEDFVKLLDRAVAEKQDAAAREELFAQSEANSWAKRAEDIAKYLHQHYR